MPSEGGKAKIETGKGGSYAARWLKLSRDDVPQTGNPPRPNSVVLAIMANGNSTNEKSGNHQQRESDRYRSESQS